MVGPDVTRDSTATGQTTGNVRTELCGACDAETRHRIAIEHLTMSKRAHNREFSRQPFRVSRCLDCGEVTRERL